MPSGATLAPPAHVLPDTPPPGKTFRLLDRQMNQRSASTHSHHESEPPCLPSMPHTTIPSTLPQPTADYDSSEHSVIPQGAEAEDEYTLSAYGDISLSEVIVPPLPSPTRSDPLQPGIPRPRLRLKVQRPPMPKRRLGYYVPDPLPHSGDLESDDSWPGSPRPVENILPWTQHQTLMSPLPADPRFSWAQESKWKPVGKGGSSFENILDELLPRSPSIRLSPPGSPAGPSRILPRGPREQKRGVRKRGDLQEVDEARKLPVSQSPLATPLRQEKPWRTRLPPRPPIPKWDV